ncbi:MAG TPA: menaquinone biosynthesis protein [Phycisphaerae bacterium]|nr:menaquinone biosynthesis protein [Phycisphaerae bacterium]
MSPESTLIPPIAPAATATLGVVSFLNALPLYESLLDRRGVVIKPAVPSKLSELLTLGGCDAALLPVVDYWRNRERLTLVADGCIASDGETQTVRVFSKVPPDKVQRVHVDGDSHTSIVLARLVWRELYSRDIELISCRPAGVADEGMSNESVLLIGDKVVRNAPRGFGFEVDLGAAWKHLTDLPFVFAAWYGPKDRDHRAMTRLLAEARDAGVADARRIAGEHAAIHGWPVDVATKYLCEIMRYRLTPPMHAAMDRFFHLADRHGLLP